MTTAPPLLRTCWPASLCTPNQRTELKSDRHTSYPPVSCEERRETAREGSLGAGCDGVVGAEGVGKAGRSPCPAA